jgi:hypothetical protein
MNHLGRQFREHAHMAASPTEETGRDVHPEGTYSNPPGSCGALGVRGSGSRYTISVPSTSRGLATP